MSAIPFEGNIYMWLSFLIISLAVVSYSLEKISMEVTSLLVIAALLLMFQLPGFFSNTPVTKLDTSDILKNFGNPALISVMALLVMGQGLFQSGVIEQMTTYLQKWGDNTPIFAIPIILIFTMIISAFFNNTPVVLMAIPIITAMGKVTPASQSLMPLSFICILGGMTTLIGSSTNLLVAGVASEYDIKIDFFSMTPIALLLVSFGAIYIIFIMPYFLRHFKEEDTSQPKDSLGKQYLFEMRIPPNSPLIGIQSRAGLFTEFGNITLRMIEHHGKNVLPPFDNHKLQSGNILVFAATRLQLTHIISDAQHPLYNIASTTLNMESPEETHQIDIADVVVAPSSRLIGQTVYRVGFFSQTGCRAIGVQRRSRMLRQNLRDIRLEAGDVLLVIGATNKVRTLRSNRDVLLLEWSTTTLPNSTYTQRAKFIFIATILITALNILPIVTSAFLGALAMMVSGVLNIRQAIRSIDTRIFFTIIAALSMSTALEKTGGTIFLTESFLSFFSTTPIWITLSAFFLLCAITTNILSNNATAVLFTPIAIKISHDLSVSPEAFIFAVIFAANCSFATPMAYQTNLLIMTPGNYLFKDFLRMGIPLIIIIWLCYTFFAPWYFNLI